MKTKVAVQFYVAFVLMLVATLALVGGLSYLKSAREVEKQVEKFLSQVLQTALHQTDLYLKTYEYASNSIISNVEVRRYLDVPPEDYYNFWMYYNRIKQYVLQPNLQYHPQVNLIYVLGKDGRVVFSNSSTRTVAEAELSGLYDELWEIAPPDGRMAIWNPSSDSGQSSKSVTVVRRIRSMKNWEYAGVLGIEFQADELSRLWESVDLGEQGFFFIVDDEGRFIYHPDKSLIGMEWEDPLAVRLLEGGGQTFTGELDGQTRMFVARTSSQTGWHMAVSMPQQELRNPISAIRSTTLAVGLAALMVSALVAFWFVQRITRPIRLLKEGMRQTEKGNWQLIQSLNRTDEFGQLIHSYNLMVNRLSVLIDTVYREQLERQQAQYQALQLQINPHFLYNTLATMNSYAIERDAHEISEMSEAMSFMLRYAIQTNLEEITVANELNHIRNYLIIMSHRLQREFEIDVLIPPSLLLEKMVPLTLQPLVENAFQHAFPIGIQEHHRIRIDAGTDAGVFQVIVEDNGAGIPEERLQQIMELFRQKKGADTPGGRRGSIGLVNVHRRIQLVFGEEYGLSLEAVPEGGTRIVMSMPAARGSRAFPQS